jgi:hypothetical protein
MIALPTHTRRRQWLMHFTRASTLASALDNLETILQEGRIRASGRMIADRRPVVCLFDLSLEQVNQLLEPRARRRYQPFGIALERRHAFALGARPAIYLPRREASQLLGPEQQWRVVSLELSGAKSVDWTFEHEWRMPGDLCFTPSQALALVESWPDVDVIYQRFAGRPPCAGVLPLNALTQSA